MSLWTRIARVIGWEARGAVARLADPTAAVDAAYRTQLEIVDDARRGYVDLVAARHRLAMELAAMERRKAHADEIDAFRRDVAELQAREREIAASIGRLSARAEALRAERERTRANVAAARASIAAHEAIAGLTPEHVEIRTLLEDARDRRAALDARARALAELVRQDASEALARRDD